MKAILILDNMPQGCNKCNYLGFQDITEKRACMLTTNSLFIQNVDELDVGRDISCPLKPLPNKISHSEIEEVCDYWEIEGYNSCLDEILGDKE